jgi:hypothetical protein
VHIVLDYASTLFPTRVTRAAWSYVEIAQDDFLNLGPGLFGSGQHRVNHDVSIAVASGAADYSKHPLTIALCHVALPLCRILISALRGRIPPAGAPNEVLSFR